MLALENLVFRTLFYKFASKKDIALDRKILSDIAISDNSTFKKIVKIATS